MSAPNSWLWQPDPDVDMPANVQARQHALDAARDGLALRDDDPSHADDYLEMSDRFYMRALAISAEWHC